LQKQQKNIISGFFSFSSYFFQKKMELTEDEILLKNTLENLLQLPKDVIWRIFFLSNLTVNKIKSISLVNPQIRVLLNNESLWDLMFISKIMNRTLPVLNLRSEMPNLVNKYRNDYRFRQWTALKKEYPDHFIRFAAFSYYLEVYENKRNVIFTEDVTKRTVLIVRNTSRTELQGIDDLGNRERKKVYKTIEEITFLLIKSNDETLRDILKTTTNETARSLFDDEGEGEKKKTKNEPEDVFEFVQSKFTMLETIGKIYRIIQAGYAPRLASGEGTEYMNTCICSRPAQFVCGGCMDAHYCSEACQRMDWEENLHKINC
jgi:hypothetical protein